MRKLAYFSFIFGLALSMGVIVVSAAPTSTIVQNLFIIGLESSGFPCLNINSAGLVATTTCGSGGTTVFKANGGSFMTSSTVNFAQGTNITITTSSDGTYTINSSGGGGGGVGTSSPAIGYAYFVNGNTLSGTSTIVNSVNGSTGIITITSSSLNVATNTISLFNGNGFITAAPATATISSAGFTWTGPFTFATSSGISITSSSGNIVFGNTGILNNLGNWAGTWQGVNSSTFYLASNPSGYITTSSVVSVNGLTGIVTITSSSLGVATNTLSLFNGNGFITAAPATSTIIASGTTLTGPSFTFASTTTILPFASGSAIYWNLVNTGNWAGKWNNYNTTDFLVSSTAFVANNAGNWAGTWQGVNSSTFYLASNPSGYITTSTNNFGGITNASVTALSPILWSTTSTISCPTCLTTSTYNASMTIAVAAPITGGGALTNGATISVSCPTCLTTSTGLGILNFATTSVSQWANDAGYVTSTGTGINSAVTNDIGYYNSATTINGTSTFTFTPGTGNATATLEVGTSSSVGCIAMIDQTNSSTMYYQYWKGGRMFTDTNSCM